jgi:hypothetical protein
VGGGQGNWGRTAVGRAAPGRGEGACRDEGGAAADELRDDQVGGGSEDL